MTNLKGFQRFTDVVLPHRGGSQRLFIRILLQGGDVETSKIGQRGGMDAVSSVFPSWTWIK